MHPPAQAYVTNTHQKFYFYPQFERTNNFKSMQNKMERSQSAGDVFDTERSESDRLTQPKRIRTQSEIISNRSINLQSSEKVFPLRSSKFAPRELFGPESLCGTPTDGDLSHLDEQFFDCSINQEDKVSRYSSFENSRGSNHHSSFNDWEVVKRTDSNSDVTPKIDKNPGRTLLVVGFFEVLRHAVVLLPDSDLPVILNEEVLDWQSLIVLTNNSNDDIRVSIVKLITAYLERAPQYQKISLVKNRGFLLLANQLYQYRTTSDLIQATLNLVTGRAEPLIDISNVGIPIKDIDATVLPAVAPLLALIENSIEDEILCDDLCWSLKVSNMYFIYLFYVN